jgi:hypothetical protein
MNNCRDIAGIFVRVRGFWRLFAKFSKRKTLINTGEMARPPGLEPGTY